MGRDRAVAARRLVDEGAGLLLGHGDAQVDDLAAVEELPVVAVELDPVGAVLDLLAHRPAHAVRPVGDLHALGDRDLGGVPQKRVVTGGRDRPGRHHARPLLEPASMASRRSASAYIAPSVSGRGSS
jgi:hypothetical protein